MDTLLASPCYGGAGRGTGWTWCATPTRTATSATILHAMGLANDDLFFEHNGRPERLTGVVGTARVIRDAFA